MNHILKFLEADDSVTEKLKVLASGVSASGTIHSGEHVTKTYDGPSRMADAHKDTEFGKEHRKDAADKIKAHRAETGKGGTAPFKGKDGFEVYRESVDFHHTSSVPHKEVRIQDDHRASAHKLEDGKHASHPPGGHLLTSYKGDGDTGTSHFVHTKREGDVVHFHDAKTGRHIATVSHSDLAEHNPTKSTKYFK